MEQNNQPKERFRTSVGGQALMEGIMMRGPEKICCAVRRPDGEIDLKEEATRHHFYEKIPLLRGCCSMIDSMIKGYHYLMHSAEVSMGEEAFAQSESKFDRWLDQRGKTVQNLFMGAAALTGGVLAIVLFLVIPTTLVGWLGYFIELGRWPRVILEGILKVAIFILYLYLCTRMEEIHRMFQYHGAEHKTIACYEAGLPLTVENVRKCSRFHPRCGTSFLILVLLVSIFVNAILPWENLALRVVYKILLLPVVMGISYELIKWAGRSCNPLTRAISAPGLWLQRLTTFEPEDSMMEVAIAAVTPVLPQTPEEGAW